jgi:hypothetical protein
MVCQESGFNGTAVKKRNHDELSGLPSNFALPGAKLLPVVQPRSGVMALTFELSGRLPAGLRRPATGPLE